MYSVPLGMVATEVTTRESDGLPKSLTYPESDPSPSIDRHGLPSLGIPADPSFALLHFEGAEARDRHGTIDLESLLDTVEDGIHQP